MCMPVKIAPGGVARMPAILNVLPVRLRLRAFVRLAKSYFPTRRSDKLMALVHAGENSSWRSLLILRAAPI